MFWNYLAIDLEVIAVGTQAMHASVKVINSNLLSYLTVVYAASTNTIRTSFQDNLSDMARQFTKPGFIMGDFNDLLN